MKKGFTLIEFLIYSGIVVFVILALTLTGMNILHARIKVVALEEVNKNASFSLEKIAYLIRNSEGVNSATGDTLSLKMSSPAEDPTEIYLDDGAIMISKSGNISRLTTESVVVTSLSFSEFLEDAVRVSVSFEFYNPSERKEYEIERDFKFTENVRK
jgi:hypothetical protein